MQQQHVDRLEAQVPQAFRDVLDNVIFRKHLVGGRRGAAGPSAVFRRHLGRDV